MYACLTENDLAAGFGTCLATYSTPAEWTLLAVALTGVVFVSWMAWLGEFELRDV